MGRPGSWATTFDVSWRAGGSGPGATPSLPRPHVRPQAYGGPCAPRGGHGSLGGTGRTASRYPGGFGPPAAVAAAEDPLTIAVLPFDYTGPEGQEYFADGLTDVVNAQLAGLPGLRVVSPSPSVRREDPARPAGGRFRTRRRVSPGWECELRAPQPILPDGSSWRLGSYVSRTTAWCGIGPSITP
jgi:hypothetical protein